MSVLRLALQELGNPTFLLDTWGSNCFIETGESIGDFFSDDDFKEELLTARANQDLITVAHDENALPKIFSVNLLCLLLSLQQQHHRFHGERGGVEFPSQSLEAFSSNQPLVHACFAIRRFVIERLDGIDEKSSFAGMTDSGKASGCI
jgi:hypothetical protein